jgi:hypothetical protein
MGLLALLWVLAVSPNRLRLGFGGKTGFCTYGR